jgi:hypothetical protein
MKIILGIAVTLLAGCASYASHGSWLDAVGQPPRPPVAMSDEAAGAIAAQAGQLRAQAEAARGRLARETDRRERIRDYRELEDIGWSLGRLERDLEDAGRSTVTGKVPAAPG